MEGMELMQGVPDRTMATITDIEGQRAIAEVQAAVVMAKRFPRDQKRAYDKIMLACQRPSLAESAIYSYARGGTDITGPSIRLAEAIAQCWENLDYGIRELEQRNGESTVEAYAWDIESNTRQRKIFQVAHKRHTKKGDYNLTDPRDIYETVANNGARRLRACILGLIPGDIVDAAVAQCEATLTAKADTSLEATKKLVETFKALGVTKEQIEKRIQRTLDAITPAQIVGMRKIYNSLKDGMSSAADWFESSAPAESKGMDGLKEKMKKPQGKKEPFADTATETARETFGQVKLEQSPTALTEFEKKYYDLLTAINDATTKEELVQIATQVDGMYNSDQSTINEKDYLEICALIQKRKGELK